MEDMRE